MNVTTSKSNTHLSFYVNVILEFSNKAYVVDTQPQNSARSRAIPISAGLVGPDTKPCTSLPNESSAAWTAEHTRSRPRHLCRDPPLRHAPHAPEGLAGVDEGPARR